MSKSDVDSRALAAANSWWDEEYFDINQSKATLQEAIIQALKEQDKLTRHQCAENVAFMVDSEDYDAIIGRAIRVIMNTKAV